MRFPLVARSTLEAAAQHLVEVQQENARLHQALQAEQDNGRDERRDAEAERQRLHQAINAERGRCDGLVQQLVTMKRAGYEAGLAPGSFAEPEVSLPAQVDAAIRKLARPRTPLYTELRNFAEAQLAAQVDPEAVAARITRGSDLDDLEGDEEPDTEAAELLA